MKEYGGVPPDLPAFLAADGAVVPQLFRGFRTRPQFKSRVVKLASAIIMGLCRLHSALGYLPPEEFEQAASSDGIYGATMSFFRHREIFRSDVGLLIDGKPTEAGSPDHRLDESPAGYSLAGWSPPEPLPLHQPSTSLKEME